MVSIKKNKAVIFGIDDVDDESDEEDSAEEDEDDSGNMESEMSTSERQLHVTATKSTTQLQNLKKLTAEAQDDQISAAEKKKILET